MTAPAWITPPGDLGTVVEGEFYQVQLNADNADSYLYLSGVLPVGIRVTSNGILEGNPKNYDYIQGVPTEIAQDVTSKFVVRATSLDGTVADRVFEMTVTGQDAPVIDTLPSENLGAYFDGDKVDVQLTATDPDPGDTLTWRLQSGNLPEGLSISTSGRILGYVEPFAAIDGTPGFDINNFDIGEWDFGTKSVNKNYEFTVEVSDSKQIDIKTYSLYAVSRNLATADMDTVTADNVASSNTNATIDQLLDASQTNLRVPALLTESTGLGRIKHDNRFNFQFVGKDFDGVPIDYVLDSGSLPTGLSLDTQSGWLTGTIPNFSATETNFTFGIKVRKRNNTAYVSTATSFTMTVVGDVDSTVTWPARNMTIKTGEQSQLDVVATISDNRPVQYELKDATSSGGTADPEYNNGALSNVTGAGSDFFKRELTVNGVRIMGAGTVGGQTAVPDAWLEKVARMFDLFTDLTGTGINETLQRNLIKTLSGDAGTYHAGLPTIQRVARGAGADYTPNFLTDAGIISWNLTDLFNTHVHNDMVWYLNSTGSGYGDGDNDAQEVIEHAFHTLHMHGLDAQSLKMYPSISADWATGPLYNAMVEAYDGGFWDSSGYGGANFKTDPDAFEVAAKEYLYLLNFCMFDYSDLWDGDSLAPEWSDTVKTPAGIQANLPLGYALYNTYIAPVISKPSLATIRSIFQDGNTPAQDDPSLAGASGYVVDTVLGSLGITAGNFVIGETYTIVTSGTTDFISIGSADNSVGTIFTATGIGSGSGIASLGTNKLPQGLKLNEDGLIVGRVSFENMMFDTGTTTFDISNIYTNETTFEQVYSFVARVFSADGVIDTYKKFSITINADSDKPYESLYARALPPQDQRDIYDNLIQNNDDIPSEDVYRASDYAFGIQKDIRTVIAAGLTPAQETDYVEAMSKNFWNNTLRFGGFKTARALNSDGTVKYEIVYVELVDNTQGTDPTTGLSASPALRQDVRSNTTTWANPISVDQTPPDVSHGHYLASQANDYYVYPNSIENMRSRLKTDIGYQVLERKVLPDWMKDKQADDTVLGWTLAAPIVYCKPGTSAKIKYRLEQRIKTANLDIKKISFEVDRFILDNNLSKYFDKVSQKFTVTDETSFDLGGPTTTFDGDGTRFMASLDVYVDKDAGDKYVKFPQVGPFDRLPYTER